MSKFKIGDRVKYTGENETYVCQRHMGKVGVITGFTAGLPDVNFDDGSGAPGVYEENISHLAPTSPVREVTKREIVPGVYGIVTVTGDTVYGAISQVHRCSLSLDGEAFTATELRAAAAVLLELAGALDQ